MSSSRATNSITGIGSQPCVFVSAPTCRWARSSSGIDRRLLPPLGIARDDLLRRLARWPSVHAKPSQRARSSAIVEDASLAGH